VVDSPQSFRGLPAPAKINLFLHITGRRPDGYHLLQSVFVLVDWCDTLDFERRSDGQLIRDDLTATLPADDLCLRAARLLQESSGTHYGADIAIDKQIPWGAGLGGGSSDAATTLLALNRLWGLNWPRQKLLPLALRLGADVPFFVAGDNAFVEGIGEILTPVAVASSWLAVVKPPPALPTVSIFTDPFLQRDSQPVILAGSFAGTQLLAGLAQGDVAYGHNALQEVAERLCPEVAQVAAWLHQHHGNSRMTGSGSAVFAKVGSGNTPMATWPPAPMPAGWVGRLCRTLPEHPLRSWSS
jgi:4-diphosphocytidyl-2-C-methyl-D-erythritol kinase